MLYLPYMNFPRKNEDSALDSIEHELYNPKIKSNEAEIHRLKAHRTLDLPTSWGGDAPVLVKGQEATGFSFGTKLLFFSTILLCIALAFSVWRVVSLRNVVSAANIDMVAEITPYIEGGETTPLALTLHNRNTTALQSAQVTLLYKQGNGSQDEQEKVQDKREMGEIKPNESRRQDFTVLLYGSESEKRDLVLKLEYKVAGSNATFTKLVTTQVILRTPPISVSIEGPSKLSLGQLGTYSLVVKNNSATTTLPSVLQLIMPNSFTVESATPKPIPLSNSWSIKSLAPGDSFTIAVTGSFDGKQGETATFSAKIGSVGEESSVIGIVYSSQAIDIMLNSSPLVLSMTMTSEGGISEALRYGDKAVIVLNYSNGSLQALDDVSIKLSLSGDAALYSNIDPINGYYDSVQKTITWDKATLPDLAVLSPSAQGTLRIIIPIVQKGINSPVLKATLVGTASAKDASDIVTTVHKTWGVQGMATLEARTQYKDSLLVNTGPIPPQPNQETTYTAVLKVSAQNLLSTSKVSFTLPAYVTWKNLTTDASAVVYDSKTRTVTWNAGKVAQGSSTVVSIMLGVKPSQSHVNQSPAITSGIILDAEEEVSRARLRTTLSPLTTAVYREVWNENPSLVVDR